MATTVHETPFLRQLATSDSRTRDKALENLKTYLRGRSHLDELELLKLWKGLFYCMWMSDRPRTQQQLAVDLASLVSVLPQDNVFPFLDAFWKTMAREWDGIDVLRMDKFLFLVRQYLCASLRYLATQDWSNIEFSKKFVDVMQSTPLNPQNNKIPNGLRYHMLDIYVDELSKADTQRAGKFPLDLLLQPLRELEISCPTKSIRKRAAEALADERLRDWTSNGGEGGKDSMAKATKAYGQEQEWSGIDEG